MKHKMRKAIPQKNFGMAHFNDFIQLHSRLQCRFHRFSLPAVGILAESFFQLRDFIIA